MVSATAAVATIGYLQAPSSHSHLRIYREEPRTRPIPFGYQAQELELEDFNFEILTPFKITRGDQDTGTCLLEFNSDCLDFSRFDQNSLEKLKKEIRKVEEQKDLKHLIISFYDCHSLKYLKNVDINEGLKSIPPMRMLIDLPESLLDEEISLESRWNVNGGDYFADLFMEAKTYCRLNGKKLSIIHNEPTLQTYGSIAEPPGFVHTKFGDAIRN